MNPYIAKTAMVQSSVMSDDYRATRIEDRFYGAHADGYDYADYQADAVEWAKLVWDVAGTHLEGYLFICAVRDWSDYQTHCEDGGQQPLPRGKWCEAHVAGQIDRALEIANELGW